MKVVYMGTPEFAVEALKSIAEAGHEIVCVITQPDKPKNRGKKMQSTPVKEAAEKMVLTIVQPEKIKDNQEFIDYIKSLEPDIGIVAAYGKILPKELLSVPKYGCLNIHASLLPKLRGAAPIQRAILEGYLYSGVTIMKMDEGLDTGNMIAKRIISISGMTSEILHDELMVMGSEMIVEILDKLEKEGENALIGEEQDHSQATYAHMIKKEDGKIDFSKTADEIFLQINALDPWPSAYADYEGQSVKLKDPEWYGSSSGTNYGEILEVSPKGMVVQCKDSLLLIHTIQFPNKKAMSVGEFIKGNTLKTGVVLK